MAGSKAASSGSSSWRTCSGPRGPERRSTGSRHGVRASFQGADLDPRTAGVGGVPRVHIDIGVLVHGIAIPMGTPALPHVAGGVAVAPRPPERRCRSGGCGRGRERPPLLDAWYGIGDVGMCTPMPPSPVGSLPVQRSLREGYSAPLRGGGSPVRRPPSRCVRATAEDRARTRGERQTVGCRERRAMSRRFGSPETLGCGKAPVRESRPRAPHRS